MEQPAALLEDLSGRLAVDGRVWIYSHVDRPFDPLMHPQDFRFWQLVNLTSRFFSIADCGLIREGRLFPYVWWAVLRPRTPGLDAATRRVFFILKCGLQYSLLHAVRAIVKAVKLMGLRRLLPSDLQF